MSTDASRPALRLSPARVLLLARALGCLLLARLLVATLPFTFVAQLWGLRSGAAPAPPASAGPHLAETVWAVGAAARRAPWSSTCLDRALVGLHLLGRHRIPATLHLGARLGEERRLTAHAWLTAADRILIGGEDVSVWQALARFHRSAEAAA